MQRLRTVAASGLSLPIRISVFYYSDSPGCIVRYVMLRILANYDGDDDMPK